MLYVAGKYSDVSKEAVKRNIHEAELVAQRLLAAGHIPFIPHKQTSFWDKWGVLTHWTHSDWLTKYCYPAIDRCDGVIFCPGWEFSKGAVMEHAYAVAAGLPVYFDVEEI